MWTSFFAAGGWPMYPTSVGGFHLVAASLLYAWRPERKTARLLIPLSAVTFAAGLLGTTSGMCQSLHYIPRVPEANQLTILALGCEESLHDLVLALILLMLAGVLSAIGMVRRAPNARLATHA
jgi:hypothetical protein